MSSKVALCLLYTFVATALHMHYRPIFLADRQLLIVAFMDTFVAVSVGVAVNALFVP